LQILDDQLHRIDQHGRPIGGEVDSCREAPGMASLSEELLRLGRVVSEIALALAELIEGDGPLLEAAGTAGFITPTPSSVASTIADRSIAMDMARRTRTSLKGALSVRMARLFTTLAGNSAVWRLGRRRLKLSLICTQSTRLMVPEASQPRSYLPPRNAAI